ncbi:MAG: PAS domain S-box protein [candidate division NC10 bacterium]|nr:PAS domain S-box protein [candidate division NC10 bacterium]
MAHSVDNILYKLSPAFGGRPLPPSQVKRLRWLGLWAPTTLGAVLLVITLTSFQSLSTSLLVFLVLGMSAAGIALFAWYWFVFAQVLWREEEVLNGTTDRAILSSVMSSPSLQSELILNATGEGIYGLDLQGNITCVNPAVTRTTGYEPNELIGRPIHTILDHSNGGPYVQDNCPIYAALKDGVVRHVTDGIFCKRDGTSLPVEYTAMPNREDGKIVGAVVTFRDITKRKQTEESLRWLEKAVQTMQLGVTITGITGEILYTNPAEANMHGYAADDLVGKDVRIFAPNKLWKPMALDQIRAMNTWKRQSVNIRKDGGGFPVQLMSDVVMDADGEPMAIVTSCEDITERKQVEKELRTRVHQLERLYTIGVALTSVLDYHAALQTIAEEARALMQAKFVIVAIPNQPHLRVEALAGDDQGFTKNLRISLDPASPLGQGPTAKAFRNKVPVAIEDVLEDSSFAPWRGAASRVGIRSVVIVPLLYREEVRGFLMAFSDVPQVCDEGKIQLLTTLASQAVIAMENSRLYEELWQAARQLEARVEERTRELHAANLQLEEARNHAERVSGHKTEFLANMSHELRTPLNAILGFSELLMDEKFGPLNEKQQRYVGNVFSSGRHLLNLINDLLDLSKVEAGKMAIHREQLSLREALEEALNLVNWEGEKKNLHLALTVEQDLSSVFADPVRFRQILYNLLSNAVKFTPKGGTVTVSARCVQGSAFRVQGSEGTDHEPSTMNHEPRGDFIEIRVQDTGIGIAAEDLSKLFQPFTQLEPVYAKEQQGTGLGLALTKRLVELHGGQIRAESEGEDQGSTFTVRLPISAE